MTADSIGAFTTVGDSTANITTGLGGLASSCANFIRQIDNALAELQDELRDYNRAERNRFNRNHKRDIQ